jgi:hypothetical protein
MKDNEIQEYMKDAEECAADIIERFGTNNSVLIAAMVIRQTLKREGAAAMNIKVHDEKLRVGLLDVPKVSTVACTVH